MAHTFPPSRFEAFSDGVIAVIITIMVLELKVPHEDGMAGLRAVAPILGIYALSFAFVGIYWVNHHLLVHRLREVSPRVLWANLIWLFCLSLLPYFTSYVLAKRVDSFSVAIYAASLALTAFGFRLLRKTIEDRRRAEGTFERAPLAVEIKWWGSLASYVVAIPLAYWHALLALGIIGTVALVWVVPTLGVEGFADGAQHPPHSR